MEKYLRLLNPKSVNYEADRIDGGSLALTAQDVLLAMSFAKLTGLQDNLIRLKFFGANSPKNILDMSNALLPKYQNKLDDHKVNPDYHLAVVKIAIIEFCAVPSNYKPTVRGRGVLGGVSYLVIHRHLDNHINHVLENLNQEFKLAFEKIFFQLNKNNLT